MGDVARMSYHNIFALNPIHDIHPFIVYKPPNFNVYIVMLINH